MEVVYYESIYQINNSASELFSKPIPKGTYVYMTGSPRVVSADMHMEPGMFLNSTNDSIFVQLKEEANNPGVYIINPDSMPIVVNIDNVNMMTFRETAYISPGFKIYSK